MGVIIVLGLGILLLTICLIQWGNDDWRDVGKSLPPAALVALAVLLLQFHLESERHEQEKEEQFRISIGFARDLTGLDPEFPLAGMYLSGKSLNKAELAGEDLRDTNLQGATLKGADLRGATLDGANLFGANLAGARTKKASFRRADLRGTMLHLSTGIESPRAEDFARARVNARTCWPDEFLATLHSPGHSELREALKRDESRIRGRTLVDDRSARAYGRACGLADESIWDSLALHGSPDGDVVPAELLRQTAHGLAVTFGRSVPDLLNRFAGARPMRALGSPPPEVQPRICAGTWWIEAHLVDLTAQGSAGWMVRRPGQERGRILLVGEPEGEPGDVYRIRFGSPLPAGTTLTLIVEEPNRAEHPYALRRQVRTCHARSFGKRLRSSA